MTAPKRFASWAAVSSLPQAKKISLEDQLAVNREHAARHGGVVVEELVVPGESRDIVLFEDAARRMPAYARLYELIQARAFDVLIFLDRSRLGRKAVLSMAVVSLCAENGIAVYEVESPPASLDDAARQTHSDMLIGAIKSVDAENEISKLKERHRKGMIGRTQRGEPANRLVYGYAARYDAGGKRVIAIDEAAAAVVRRIMALYLGGRGPHFIARALNADSIPTPSGGSWERMNVINILDHVRRYAGYAEINRRSERGRQYVQARGNWQPIIDEETGARVEAERQYRRDNRRRVNTDYILTGVVFCRHCGRRLVVQGGRPKLSHQRRSLQMLCKCAARCNISYRRVLAKLRERMESLRGVDLDELAAAAMPLDSIRERIAQQEARIAELDAALARADNAYVRGVMTLERYEAQVGKIAAERAAAHEHIAELQVHLGDEAERGARRVRLGDAAALGAARLDDPDYAATNAWLRSHVRIWVDGNRVFAFEWI